MEAAAVVLVSPTITSLIPVILIVRVMPHVNRTGHRDSVCFLDYGTDSLTALKIPWKTLATWCNFHECGEGSFVSFWIMSNLLTLCVVLQSRIIRAFVNETTYREEKSEDSPMSSFWLLYGSNEIEKHFHFLAKYKRWQLTKRCFHDSEVTCVSLIPGEMWTSE